ncbi:MAG: ferritin [Chloroflexi bacterium]|nr:ferritin [Chloroflexota bacterium]
MNDKVQAALNTQINMELGAFYTYLSMAAYFEADGLKGFSAWMRHHAEEEMMHAMKLYDFIHARRGRVTLKALGDPKTVWENPVAAFEDALKHEQKVTAAINALVDLAREERDHATHSFLQWFVDEQVEEEEIVDDAIQKLRRIGDFGPGLYLLDREMAASAASSEGQAESEAGEG